MASSGKIDRIEGGIHLVRGERIMLDSDLAMFCWVTTKQLNRSGRYRVKRNQNSSNG